VVVPKDLKIPPLEQHQKRGFCKYHNYLGHKTSRCSLFRDLVQKRLNEGRLKFGDKPKPQMQVDSDPFKDASMMYADIAGCNMVEAIIEVVEDLSIEAEVEAEADVAKCQMVKITEDAEYVEETTPEPQFDENLKAAYHTAEEKLIDFLNRCKLKNSEVMLCPICSVVFDKVATKGLKGFIGHLRKGENGMVIIGLSFPLQRVISLSSITPRPLIMSRKVVNEKLLFLMHPTINRFNLPIRMCNMEKNNVVKRSTNIVANNKDVLPLSRKSMLTVTTTRERIP